MIRHMWKDAPTKPVFAKTVLRSEERRTEKNLAFDLRDMDDLRERGIPISSATLSDSFYDGVEGNTFDVPFEQRRFVDINDAWNHSQDMAQKLTKAQIVQTDLNPK